MQIKTIYCSHHYYIYCSLSDSLITHSSLFGSSSRVSLEDPSSYFGFIGLGIVIKFLDLFRFHGFLGGFDLV
jgi:hypothetical protein